MNRVSKMQIGDRGAFDAACTRKVNAQLSRIAARGNMFWVAPALRPLLTFSSCITAPFRDSSEALSIEALGTLGTRLNFLARAS